MNRWFRNRCHPLAALCVTVSCLIPLSVGVAPIAGMAEVGTLDRTCVSTRTAYIHVADFATTGRGERQDPVFGERISVNVSVPNIRPDQLVAKTSQNRIAITLLGGHAQTNGCGWIHIGPLPTGVYEIDLYAEREIIERDDLKREFVRKYIAFMKSHIVQVIGKNNFAPVLPASGEFAETQSIGKIAFQHSVTLDGAATGSIPLWVPPGRQGMQPSLALTYSSRSGNGPLGAGWQLTGLSAVSTCRRSPALDGSYGGRYPDRLCLDGQRLVEISRTSALPLWDARRSYRVGQQVQFDSYAFEALKPTQGGSPDNPENWKPLGRALVSAEFRTEVDSYRKIVAYWITQNPSDGMDSFPHWLEVFEPNGSILRYGRPYHSLVGVGGAVFDCTWGHLDTSGPMNFFVDKHEGCRQVDFQRRVWMLREVEDRFGNLMKIDYDDTEPLLPTAIRYTYHHDSVARKAVIFIYEKRPDVRRTTLDGIRYTTAKRLKEIQAQGPRGLTDDPSAPTVTLRRYALSYVVHPVTRQSILSMVTECTGGTESEACFAPLLFGYTGKDAITFTDRNLHTSPADMVLYVADYSGFRTADLNGDGFDDVLYRLTIAPFLGEWKYRFSTGSNFGQEQSTNIITFDDFSKRATNKRATNFVNLDRDQNVDGLIATGDGTYSVLRGNGQGKFQTLALGTGVFNGPVGVPWPIPEKGSKRALPPPEVLAIGDLNGDAYPDLVVSDGCRDGPTLIYPENDTKYPSCRWGAMLNRSTASEINFAKAEDFAIDRSPCKDFEFDDGGKTNYWGYVNCAEILKTYESPFIVDIDGNGQNEVVVPVRGYQPPSKVGEVVFPYPNPFLFNELKTLSFPNHVPETVGRTGLRAMALTDHENSTLKAVSLTRAFLDVNGDGLADSAYLDNQKLWVQMNVGGSFDVPVETTISAVAMAALGRTGEIRIGDFNGDALEDIYLVGARLLLRSNGQLGFDEVPIEIPLGDDGCVLSTCPDSSLERRKWDQLLDFNGDGLVDFIQLQQGTIHVLERDGPPPGLLETVTGDRLTPQVRFRYQPAPTVHKPETCAYPQYCLRKGMWFVSEIGIAAVPGPYPAGFNRTFYSYAGGRFDQLGRGWLGVSTRTMTDEQTGTTLKTVIDNRATQPLSGSSASQSATKNYRYPGAFRPQHEELVTHVIDNRKKAVAAVEGRDQGRMPFQVDTIRRFPTDPRLGKPIGVLLPIGIIRRISTDFDYSDEIVKLGPGGIAIARTTLRRKRTTLSEAPLEKGISLPFFTPFFTPLTSSQETWETNEFGLVTNQIAETFEGGFAANKEIPESAKVKRLEIRRIPGPVDQANWLIRRYEREVMVSTEPERESIAESALGPARPSSTQQNGVRTTDLEWLPGTMTITRVTVEPNAKDPGLSRVTDLKHDSMGNLKSVTSSAGSFFENPSTRVARMEWDSVDQTLIARTINGLEQTEGFLHYAGLGALYATDGRNGLRTMIRRDLFGRPRQVKSPSSDSVDISYELDRGALTVNTKTATGAVTRRVFTSWGAVSREEVSRLHGRIAVVQRTFNRLKQLESQTMPFYSDSDEGGGADADFYSYDNLGRLVEHQIGRDLPNHGVETERLKQDNDPRQDVERWSYEGLTTKYENARGTVTTTTVDGAGRVMHSYTVDPESKRAIGTWLEYRPFNLLETITDVKGNRTVFDYDGLGRPKSMTDPTSGKSLAVHNGFGEMIASQDAAGQTQLVRRDPLGRIQEIQYGKDGTIRTATNVWDIAAHGIGMLAESTSTDGIKTIYSYDDLSRPTEERLEIPEANGSVVRYAIGTEWDPWDRPAVMRYPAVEGRRFAVRYIYQPSGRLHKIENADTAQEYWSLRGEDASGVHLSEVLGGQISTNLQLDQRKRVKLIETTKAVQDENGTTTNAIVQRIAYDYTHGGLVKSRHDLSPDQPVKATEDYSYDFLGRLTTWHVYQGCRRSIAKYDYDVLGNLTAMNVSAGEGRTATLKYGPSDSSPNAGPCAVQELSENGITHRYKYDPLGRRVDGDGKTVSWNEFDLPQSIQSGTQSVRFDYDAAQRRTIMRNGNGTETTYIGELYERRTVPGRNVHVFNLLGPTGVFGQVTWKPQSSGTSQEEFASFHSDLLGTPDAIISTTDSTERVKYEPWGQRRYPWALAAPAALTSDRSVGFTGHEPDDESQFINMKGRIYDPLTTRFLTPDPLVSSMQSQALNRYSYVLNNPVNLVDPTGFQSTVTTTYGGAGGGGGSGGNSGNWPTCLFLCEMAPPAGYRSPGVTSSNSTQFLPPTREDQVRSGTDAGTSTGGFLSQDGYFGNVMSAFVDGYIYLTRPFNPLEVLSGNVRWLKGWAKRSGLATDMDLDIVDLIINVVAPYLAMESYVLRGVSLADELTLSIKTLAAEREVARTVILRGAASIGTRGQFRDWVLEKLLREPKNPLRFLLNSSGTGFKQVGSRAHSNLINNPDIWEAGHVTSEKIGGTRLMIQSAWENQVQNILVEHRSVGGAVLHNQVVEVGGLPVSRSTVLWWEELGFLPPGTAASAPVLP